MYRLCTIVHRAQTLPSWYAISACPQAELELVRHNDRADTISAAKGACGIKHKNTTIQWLPMLTSQMVCAIAV